MQVLARTRKYLWINCVLELARRLQHVEHVAREIWIARTTAFPECEGTVRTLELAQLVHVFLHGCAERLGRNTRQWECATQIGGVKHDKGARGTLLGAPVRIVHDVAGPFAKADERRRRQREVEAAE